MNTPPLTARTDDTSAPGNVIEEPLKLITGNELLGLIRRLRTRSNGNVVIQGKDVDTLKRALTELAQHAGIVK